MDSPFPGFSPVRGGQVLLLLELLLQAHELQLGEDGTAPAGLLLPRRGLLRLRLATAKSLTPWGLVGRGLGDRVAGQGLGSSRGGGDQVGDDRGLPGDHGEERVCPKGSGAWKTNRAPGHERSRSGREPGPLRGPLAHFRLTGGAS